MHHRVVYNELEQAAALVQAAIVILRQTIAAPEEAPLTEWSQLREARLLLSDALPMIERVAAHRTPPIDKGSA